VSAHLREAWADLHWSHGATQPPADDRGRGGRDPLSDGRRGHRSGRAPDRDSLGRGQHRLAAPYAISAWAKVRADYRSLDPSIRPAVLRAIKDLRKDPMHGKRLVGSPPRWRIRVGDWRVVYAVEGNHVILLRIAHRSQVYRHLDSMGSWRAISDHAFWEDYDAVIATDATGRGRNFEVWTFGAAWATRHSLDEAKASVEEVYGPLRWRMVKLPPQIYDHYYFGPTTEFTDPVIIRVVDHLPNLG
jgi:mRNA-degrading endonuclease RelE of RelBE toxin-antitoxin system